MPASLALPGWWRTPAPRERLRKARTAKSSSVFSRRSLRPSAAARPREPSASTSEALMGGASRRDGQWLLIGDGQPVGFERHHLARMIGEHAQALEPEVNQNLRADAAFMLQQALPRGILIELPASVIQHAGHLA